MKKPKKSTEEIKCIHGKLPSEPCEDCYQGRNPGIASNQQLAELYFVLFPP